MKLSILIVNYNTESHIESLLNTLKNQTLDGRVFEIVIINNVQNNKLKDMIDSNRFHEIFQLKLIASERNIGFGRAMNLAAEHAQGELLLLMNPDMRMLQDDYLVQLLEYTKQHPKFGVISTQVLDDDGQDVSTYHYYEFGETLGYDNQICWFQGSLMLINADVFANMQGFDADFFMYCEDVDLCYRLKRADMPLLKCETLSIYHYGGASEPSADYHFYYKYYKSRFLFAHKHYPSQMYDKIVHQLNDKSSQRVKLYRLTAPLIKSHKIQLARYRATMDITNKILSQSSDWLYDWETA